MRPTLSSVGSGQPAPRRVFRPLLRPRVSQLLDSAHQYAVTVLIAGAGYGKSVALDHWIAGVQEPLVRYDVREGSHGVFDFALGLARALQGRVKLAMRAAANAVNAAEQSTAPEVDLAVWFANYLRKFKGVVVIDDFHVAAAGDAAVSRLLAQIIERTGNDVRWVISSRTAAGLPISSWIAYGKSQMAIAERELSFTHDEATATVADFGATFSDAQLNELYAYTSGWPTALTFALLSGEGTLDLGELRARTQQMSYQYLAEQVLLGLPPEQAQFLTRVSVFDRIDADILSAAGLTDPRARMQYLKSQATFVARDSEGGIRFHDLFRDFLRDELAKDDAAYKNAWLNAGKAYEALNRPEFALAAYQTVGDSPQAVRVLAEHGFAMIEHGLRRAVVRGLAALDAAVNLDEHPEILALRANCEANAGNTERAEAWYRQAIACAASPVQHAELCLQFARELVQRRRLDGIDILEPALREELPLELKVSIMGTLATYYWQAGRSDEALSTIQEALELAVPIGDDEVQAELLHQSAYLLLMSGSVKEAGEQAMRALQVAKPLDMHALCARVQSLLHYIHATADQVSEAVWWSKQMERSATEAGDMLLQFTALSSIYELDVERGNYDALPRHAERLRAFDSHRYARASISLVPSFAMQAAWQQRFAEAVNVLSGTETEQYSATRRALRAAEIALYAAAAGSRKRAEEAGNYAQEQLRGSGDDGESYSPKRHAKTLVFLGLAHLLLGKAATAHRHIGEAEKLSGRLSDRSKALVRAARAMFVHTETRVLDADLEQAFLTLQTTGYGGVARMLQNLPIPSVHREGTSAVLTRAEIDVLRALERCGDSKAAAADLGKSSHTVDWHVKSIMKKLAVSTRREAIAFARERGLIGHSPARPDNPLTQPTND